VKEIKGFGKFQLSFQWIHDKDALQLEILMKQKQRLSEKYQKALEEYELVSKNNGTSVAKSLIAKKSSVKGIAFPRSTTSQMIGENPDKNYLSFSDDEEKEVKTVKENVTT